jgi:RNA polymerase sigma-70 factor, ECF subfamily
MLENRQIKQNLVYWPPTIKKQSRRHMSPNQVLKDEQQRWKNHLAAVASQQDKSAYQALYLHFSPKIIAFFKQYGMQQRAEELTQEVFIKVWQKAKTYQPEKAQVSTWIFTIVRNMRIDILRKKKLDEVSDDDQPLIDEKQNLEQEYEHSRSQQNILSTFKSLNSEQRNVIQKVYFEDRSHQAAADELDMTPGTVKSRIRSALKIMRGQIGSVQA